MALCIKLADVPTTLCSDSPNQRRTNTGLSRRSSPTLLKVILTSSSEHEHLTTAPPPPPPPARLRHMLLSYPISSNRIPLYKLYKLLLTSSFPGALKTPEGSAKRSETLLKNTLTAEREREGR